jgi:hypothetical protein
MLNYYYIFCLFLTLVLAFLVSQGKLVSNMRNLLITGAHHEARMKYATSLAIDLLCPSQDQACCERVLSRLHPNLLIIEPDDSDTNDIKIDAIRALLEEHQKANFEGGNAVFIITHMHQITKTAANALLKSIEESPPHKIFLALAPSKTAVLPTIASRLKSIIIKPEKLSSPSIDEKYAETIWAITRTAPTARFSFCEQFPNSRPELLQNLLVLLECCHELLRASCDHTHAWHRHALAPVVALRLSEALHDALAFLQRNTNARLTLEHLLLSSWPYACAP